MQKSREQIHYNMSRIRAADTKPEREIRSCLHRIGFRFRKNVKRIAGSPDIVLKRYGAVIFVNGCFWHRHDCSRFKLPKTNQEFWLAKFERNVARDKKVADELMAEGWRVCVLWECSITGTGKSRARNIQSAAERISYWLEEEVGEMFLEI